MAYFLIFLGVVMRFLPHPANFAPIAAIGLFSGCYLKKWYAYALPLAAMLISDMFIGFYSWKIMLSVYLSFALIGLIGTWLKNHKNTRVIVGSAFLGSVCFFLITNFAVWAFSPLYPHSWDGLVMCYTAAIPFFRNTILGDLFYTGVLFGSYELVRFWVDNYVKRSASADTTSAGL